MIFFLLALLAISLYKCKIRPIGFFDDYISPQKTGSLKGVFIVVIMLSHVRAYISMTSQTLDASYTATMSFIGQAMVALFFFYSGYGIYESVKKRPTYFDGFIENRVFRIFMHFGMSVIVYWTVSELVLGTHIGIDTLVRAFLGFKSIGNSSWFIFTMLLVYIFAFLSFRLLKFHPLAAIGGILALTLGFAVCIELNNYEALWYDTAFCFAAGFVYSYFRPTIERLVRRHQLIYLAALLLTVGGYILTTILYRESRDLVLGTLKNVIFVLAVTVLSMRLSLHNPILEWLGRHSFSIFLVHRIPMILLSHFGVFADNKYLFTVLVILITLPLSCGFTHLCDAVDRLIYPKKKA